VQHALLGSIISTLSVVPGSLVGRGSIIFVLALAILRLVVVLLTFVHIVAISIAKPAFILANVAALVGVVTVLAAMFAVAFAAFLGLCLGWGIGHATSKGRICVLSFWRKCDLFLLVRLLQLVFLAYDADELLAIDAPLRIYVSLVIVLVLAHIWACKLVPGSRERCRNLLLEEVVIVDLLQLAREQDLFPLVLEFRQVLRDVGAFSDLDATEDANAIGMNKITSRLVDRLEVIPHLVCIGTSTSVNLLRGSNVLVNQHPRIGIIELPIVCTYRIEAGVGAWNAALDVALGVGAAKEHVHGFCPASPVLLLLVQCLVDPRYSR